MWSHILTGGTAFYNSQVNALATGTAALVADVLRGSPFIVGKGFAIDRLTLEVSTGVAGNVVLGIYDTKLGGTLYPNNLFVQGTSQSTLNPVVISDNISASLRPNTLYWLCYNADAAPTVRTSGVGSLPIVLGNDGTGAASRQKTGWTVARTFNATLPSTFTAGGTVMTNSIMPLIQVRAT